MVANALGTQGYEVWFDEDILDSKGGWGKRYTKEELIEILTEAARQSRCSVVFEAELEMVALLPDTNIEEECQKKTIMLTESGPVAWNWQKLEIDASSRSIAIHPSAKMVLVFDNGIEVSHMIGLPLEPYTNPTVLLQRILQSLNYFGIAPSRHS